MQLHCAKYVTKRSSQWIDPSVGCCHAGRYHAPGVQSRQVACTTLSTRWLQSCMSMMRVATSSLVRWCHARHGGYEHTCHGMQVSNLVLVLGGPVSWAQLLAHSRGGLRAVHVPSAQKQFHGIAASPADRAALAPDRTSKASHYMSAWKRAVAPPRHAYHALVLGGNLIVTSAVFVITRCRCFFSPAYAVLPCLLLAAPNRLHACLRSS